MKKLLGVVTCLTLLATNPVSADDSLVEALKDSSSGTVSSRFRGGYFIGK